MKTLQVEKREIKLSDYVTAQEVDYRKLIKEDCIIKEGDRTILVYLHLHEHTEDLIKAIRNIHIGKNKRIRGLVTHSRIFGYMPREKIRKDFCSSTSLARDSPNEHRIICDFGSQLAKYYQVYAPELYREHSEIVESNVKAEWRLKGSPFTSGIINKNNVLKYHYDRGNFKKVYSNMIAFKKDVQGGYLVLPEYDFALEIADSTVAYFDGQKILHGVTPIKFLSEKAYRFSLVYYTLKQMWQCLTPQEEINRIKKVKTEREVRRYKRLTGEIPNTFK